MSECNSQLIKQLLKKKDKENISYLQSFFNGRRVLVTGAGGSIGGEISRFLTACNCEKIILLDCAETSLHNLMIELEEHGHLTNTESVIVNLCNYSRVQKIIKNQKPDLVFHAAANKHVHLMEQNPYEAFATNFIGTKILCDVAMEINVEKFVYLSTDKAVYPTSIMGASKRLAEIYIQSAGINCSTEFITTRFGTVIGSNGSVFYTFKNQIEKGGPVTVTHPEVTRFVMSINEALNLVIKAMVYGTRNEIYIHEMENPVSITTFAEQMIIASGLIPGTDIKLKYTGLGAGEKLHEVLNYESELPVETNHTGIKIFSAELSEHGLILEKMCKLIRLLEDDKMDEFIDFMPELISNNESAAHTNLMS